MGVYICWNHYCVRVGMFDLLEVAFRSEIVENVVCCRRAFCCYGHLGVGVYRVCEVCVYAVHGYISWLSYLHGEISLTRPTHLPPPTFSHASSSRHLTV